MRRDLKKRLTTNSSRASRRVKWKFKDCWFALAVDEESLQWEPYGIMHRQIGTDGRGHLVWPDQTIHRFSPNYIAFYTIPTDNIAQAESLRAQLVKGLRERDVWMPLAGLVRGRVEVDTTNRVNNLEISK